MKKYLSPTQFLILLLGFYSGLPLALTASTLTAWLSDAGVERAAIGLFAAVATPYALKFLWAPLVDGIRVPVLGKIGRRRSWLVMVQALLAAAIAAMALVHPGVDPSMTALAAVLVATLSATQDIVIDAYRVERLEVHAQGTGAAMATFGYRVGMLLSGAGALALADAHGWQVTYAVMAAVMATGVVVTLVAKEPVLAVIPAKAGIHAKPPRGSASPDMDPGLRRDDGVLEAVKAFIRESVIAPFKDFMTRPHWWQVLLFVVLYKLGDAFMGVMFNPFLLDIGFTKTQIATVVKLYGLWATIAGSFAGGFLVTRLGMYRALMLCGFGHMLTNLMLVVQAQLGADVHFLTVSITLENFTGGMATTAFIAYLSALCKTHYTATQYALLSSFAAFGRTWLSTPSGALSQAVGWEVFFAIASLMAVPGLALLWWLERKQKRA